MFRDYSRYYLEESWNLSLMISTSLSHQSFKDPNLGTIKLTVGVRNRTLDKIQYGITALEENESIVTASEKNKKKAPHK